MKMYYIDVIQKRIDGEISIFPSMFNIKQ